MSGRDNIGTDTLLEYIIKGLFQKSHPLCCVPRNTDEQRVPLRNKWDSFFYPFLLAQFALQMTEYINIDIPLFGSQCHVLCTAADDDNNLQPPKSIAEVQTREKETYCGGVNYVSSLRIRVRLYYCFGAHIIILNL